MVGKHQTVIVIFDLETDELEVLGRKKETQEKGKAGPNMNIKLSIIPIFTLQIFSII